MARSRLEGGDLQKAVDNLLGAAEVPRKREVRIRLDQEIQGELSKNKGDGKPKSLAKSILNALEQDEITRLAFEADPSTNSQFASLYKAKLKLIPDKLLKRIAIVDDLVAAIVQTRCAQMAAFGRPRVDRFSIGFVVEPRQGALEKIEKEPDDAQRKEKKEELQRRIAKYTKQLMTCGETHGYRDDDRLTFPQFVSMSVRNAIILGRMATEVIWAEGRDGQRRFHSFRVIDAGTIYRASSQRSAAENVRRQARMLLEQIKNKKLVPERYENDEYAWIQVIDDRPVQAFTSKECLVHNFYQVPDFEMDGYPVTPLDTAITAVTTHINITTHNRLYFQSGRATRGMLVIKSDDVDESVVARVRQQFNASINSVNNCLAGDAQIITDQGAYAIEDFLGGRETRMMRVWTGTGWCDAMAYRVAEKKRLCSTALANGVELKTSPNHRFWAIGDDGEAGWKEQHGLRLGDYVAVNKLEASNSDSVPKLNGIPLDEDAMEVLGWMTGDGNLNERSLRLFYHHERERDVWARHAAVLKRFGAPVRGIEQVVSEEEQEHLKEEYGLKSVASVRIRNEVNGTEWVRELYSLGFTPSRRGRGSKGKTIAPFVYALPGKLKSAFLRGFFSADGNNAKGRSPCITIVNDLLRAQTRQLLLSMGIRTTLSEGKSQTGFGGNRPGKSVLRVKDRALFFEKVGFLQAHKQPVATTGTNKGWGTSSAVSRQTVLKYLRLVKDKTKLPRGGNDHNAGLSSVFTRREHMYIDAVLRGEDSCSLPRLLNYMQVAGVEAPSWMADYNYEPVVEVGGTDELVQMYDVAVYDKNHGCTGLSCKHRSHSFMANMTHCGNSWRMPVFGIGSTDEMDWVPIDSAGQRDAEFQYLTDSNARTILSAFQMSPEELPGWAYLSRGTNSQALSESNNEYRLEAARDVGIRPLISQFEDFLNAFIFPLFDQELADMCRMKLVGLDVDTPEKESIRFGQDIPIHMTYDEVLEKVEKKPVGRQMGGEYPLNPNFQAVLDKYYTVGEVKEFFMGVKGASRDPSLAYYRDPFWFQAQQMIQQQQQVQQQAQMQQMQGQGAAAGTPDDGQGGGAGGGGDEGKQPPSNGPDASQTEKQKGEQAGEASQAPQGDQGSDLSRSIDQALTLLTKSEAQLPASKRRILQRHKELVQEWERGWEKDVQEATEAILDAADLPKVE